MNWKSISRVLDDHNTPIKLDKNFQNMLQN